MSNNSVALWQFVFRRAAFYVSLATLAAHYLIEVDYLLTRWVAWHWLSHAIYFALPLHKSSVFAGQYNPASVEFHLLHGVSMGLACVAVLVFFLVQFDLAEDFNSRHFPADFSPVGMAFVNVHAYFVPLVMHLVDLWLNRVRFGCTTTRTERRGSVRLHCWSCESHVVLLPRRLLLLLALELLVERYFRDLDRLRICSRQSRICC
jgi:hypothetical protein